MKNIICKSVLSLLLATTLGACGDDFLNRTPEDSYTADNFYSSPEALKAGTAPLYTRAWFDYNSRPALAIGSCRANDVYGQYFLPEFTLFTVTALHSDLASAWQSFYSVITMANETMELIEEKATGVTEEEKRNAIAECRLMRGIAYFYLLRTWGSVILFEKNDVVVRNPVQPRHKEEDVFKFIIRDLEYASENLPETWDKGRATSWGAKGMLAKVYLARSGWDKGGVRDQEDLDLACRYAADVCNNSGLNLYDYEDLFKYKHNNNEESLIAMQWVPNGEWGVCNTLISDLAFSTEVTGGVMCWGGSLNGTVDMLEQYEAGDTIRLNATFFTNGTYYDYICISDGGYTYTGTSSPIKKGVVGGPDDDNDGYVKQMNSPLNTYILRLADVYLTYAEASLGNSETLAGGEGLEYFNKVRKRAGLKPKASINFDDIIRERRVEFAMEYTNWYDMVSWYKYKPEKMLEYFNNQKRGWYSGNVTKDENGQIDVGDEEDFEKVDPPVVVTADNIFLPYPEKDVIQNPLLKEEPQSYDFNE